MSDQTHPATGSRDGKASLGLVRVHWAGLECVAAIQWSSWIREMVGYLIQKEGLYRWRLDFPGKSGWSVPRVDTCMAWLLRLW